MKNRLIFILSALLLWSCVSFAGCSGMQSGSAVVQVLMYHHITDTVTNDMMVTPERLSEQLKALKDAGYETVTADDLIAFVEEGAPLPEKAVVLTFDDGYASNIEYAVPALEKYGQRAMFFVIGVSVGKDTYKDTGLAMIPHFAYEEALTAVETGTVSVQSHTYDMHQAAGYDDPARDSVLKMESESQPEYEAALKADFIRSVEELERAYGREVNALAYPLGKYSAESEAILKELGVKVTFITQEGSNTLRRGDSDSLRLLRRYTVTQSTTGEELVNLLDAGLKGEQEK